MSILCNKCPRKCNVDRARFKGRCSVKGEKIRVGLASLHYWEEPCISGENGSGAIFFGGCNLQCDYCQNYELSRGHVGIDIDIDQLVACMLRLQKDGAHNINLVTPSHYIDEIVEAVKTARKRGLALPIVYNTSGYETEESIYLLRNTVDIFLTDFKYADDSLGEKYSKVSDYSSVALLALRKMFSFINESIYDKEGILQKGIIVRHLVLPSHIENSKMVLDILFKEFGNKIIYSLMNQFTPMSTCNCSELNRKLTDEEYDEVVDYALCLGIENAYIQEGETQDSSFIPKFNGEGI